jgi:AcrR family transcriptional regulator
LIRIGTTGRSIECALAPTKSCQTSVNRASFLGEGRLIHVPYHHTENIARRLAGRRQAILDAACAAAAEGGMAAVQIAAVAERAGVAAGTVYRYFPCKADLVAALVATLSERETTALAAAAKAAPGPLSALAAAIVTFAVRTLASPRLASALIAEPVEPEVDAARSMHRRSLAGKFESLLRSAIENGHLPQQDAAMAAAALVGALIAGLIGPLAPAGSLDAGQARARAQMLTLFALRALGVVDARARGLVVQTALPPPASATVQS